MLHPVFQAQLPSVLNLFKKYRIKNAWAFGSVVNGNFSDDSDIDLLINFEDGVSGVERGDMWWDLYDGLRDVFNREVDLLVENSLKNPFFIEDINEKKYLIYAA
jgi:hypothetical protein